MNEVMNQVIEKINAAENVLVALSNNPSVDEMAAAIGLTLFLDKMGKHATAIYSGETPNALEFLRPAETFESNTSSLQDFIIALDKEKADHLRYKIDGAYVKVYITPYRTTLGENDFEFSHGDFNVDLVIALNVKAATDLDGALREHGRIMHDASAINITTGVPGRFGEIEWSNPETSSVSEMVANLAFALPKTKIDKDIATAFLTGIVATTNRFSNEKTTPATMNMSAKLMQEGADQQLISKNITAENLVATTPAQAAKPQDDTVLNISRGEEVAEEPAPEPVPEPAAPAEVVEPTVDGELMSELKRAAEAAMNPQPEPEPQPQMAEVVDYGKMIDEALAEPIPGSATPAESNSGYVAPDNLATAAAPMVPVSDEFGGMPAMDYNQQVASGDAPTLPPTMNDSYITEEPKKVLQPISPDLPLPGEEILPPPPTPPVDFSAPVTAAQPVAVPQPEMPQVVEPQPQPVVPLAAMQSGPVIPEMPQVQADNLTPLGGPVQNTAPQPAADNDPSAFRIPGM